MQPASTCPPPSLFNLTTGEITPDFSKQLNISGIPLKAHNPNFDPGHILNVAAELQQNGCFQPDCDFYKKGGVSKLELSYDRAKKFLDDDYMSRPTGIMPRETDLADAIVTCGVEATMHKRFDSLKKSMDQGSVYSAIHFIVKDEATKQMIEEMIKNSYGNVIRGVKTNFIVVGDKLNYTEAGLTIVKSRLSTNNYVVVTDITFAPKIEGIANKILGPQKKCLGLVASSIKDWRYDMMLYGFPQALQSQEKATIAWAQTAWNFKARQVDAEKKAYESNAEKKVSQGHAEKKVYQGHAEQTVSQVNEKNRGNGNHTKLALASLVVLCFGIFVAKKIG